MRVGMIQRMYSAGLSSTTILDILPCMSTGSVTPELAERFAAERDRIDHQIRDLIRTRNELDAMISCTNDTVVAGHQCEPQ